MSRAKLTRNQLAAFLPTPEAIRAFEQILSDVGITLPNELEAVSYTAENALAEAHSATEAVANLKQDTEVNSAVTGAQVNQLLDSLNSIAQSLALLATAPPREEHTNPFDNLGADLLPPTPLGTLGMQQSDAVSISGGNIDGTPIGQSSASTGSFTTVQTSGNAGIGSGPVATQTLRVGANLTGGTIAYGIVSRGKVQSDVTVGSYGFSSFAQFVNFAAGSHRHYSAGQGTIPGTLSVQMGFEADSSLVGATTNYGFYSNLGAAAANWNFYANGSARNYFNGNTQIGSATPTAGDEKLQVNGALSINSATMLRTYTAFTNGAGAGAGTLTNAPAAGNPTKWIPINDNGTTRYIPAW